MNASKDIYKILKALKEIMNGDGTNEEKLTPKYLNLSEDMRDNYLKLLQEEGYTKGTECLSFINGTECVYTSETEITLKGLKYLDENTPVNKIYKTAKKIADIMP